MAEMTEEAAKALRAPFDPGSIGKLPRKGTPGLDYVGHAAVTDRLLAVDPGWTWEPVAFAPDGAPLIRTDGTNLTLWIRLTVCGVTRLGVGVVSASAVEAEKQLISDALRNAAMRFGVALDLWSKQDLHDVASQPEPQARPPVGSQEAHDALKERVANMPEDLLATFKAWKDDQGFPYPWPQSAIDAMHAEIDKIAEAGGEPIPSASPPASEPEGPHGYDLWQRDELADACKDRDLPHSGNKDRLVAELRAWNATNGITVEYDTPQF